MTKIELSIKTGIYLLIRIRYLIFIFVLMGQVFKGYNKKTVLWKSYVQNVEIKL